MDYTNLTFIKIDDDRVVTIDGQKYLVVDNDVKEKKTTTKEKRTTYRPRIASPLRRVSLEKAILLILEAHPNSKRSQIVSYLKKDYKLSPSMHVLSRTMTLLKTAGAIKLEGLRNASTWSLVD